MRPPGAEPPRARYRQFLYLVVGQEPHAVKVELRGVSPGDQLQLRELSGTDHVLSQSLETQGAALQAIDELVGAKKSNA